MTRYSVRLHGASGDGRADDTGAVQAVIDDAAADGGGTVVVPSGEYEIRPIELFDGVTLHIESGAALRASTDPDDYEQGEYPLAGLIRAKGAQDIAITGRGVIDGRGMAFLETGARRSLGPDSLLEPTRQGRDFSHPRHGTADGPADDPDERPDRMFVIYNCRDVRVEGVKIVDSPFWTLHLISSADVHVSDVTIDNDRLIPNSDGIIPDMSRNVTITGCHVRAGDDAIVLKATGIGHHGRPTENIVVGDCTLVSRSSAIKFGSSTQYDIRDCVFNNLVIYDTNRALGIQHRDAGTVQDILFSNIVIHTRLHTGNWWGNAEPIWVTTLPRRDGDDVGGVRDVTFRNIECDVEGGVVIDSAPESVLEDITLDGVDLRLIDAEYAEAVGGNFDYRPDHRETDGKRLFEHDIPGIFIGHAEDVTLSDVTVAWGDDVADDDAIGGDDALPGYYSHAVEAESVSELTIDGLEGRGMNGQPVVSLAACRAVTIRDSRATEGADTFLDTAGGSDYRRFVGNDLAEAETTADAFEAFATRSGNVF